MKPLHGILVYAIAATLALLAVSVGYVVDQASDPEAGEQIKGQVMSSGGNRSTSSGYVLTGTVSQTAVGRVSSEPNDIEQGFWSVSRGYTPPGSDVPVEVTDSITVIFENVNSPGETTVTTQTSGPPPDDGYRVVPMGAPVYYDIETTADVSGNITVCFTYDESQVRGQEANLRLTHWVGDSPHRVDITLEPVDTDNNIICGVTTSLSLFALVEPCCDGRVGDANQSGGDEPTIGDISVMIDALFIGGDPSVITCLAEADVNQSGGTDPQPADITIGDISVLIDYLFITGPPLGLAECL